MSQQAPSGELITLGIGPETTYGTPVSPTVFLIPSTDGLDGTNELVPRPGARKRVGQTEPLTGLFTGKGNIQVEADPDSLGSLLLLACGAEAIAVNANNPSAQTVATTLASSIPAGFQLATPVAMTNIVKGQSLTIDTGGIQETVNVRAVSATSFWAYFKYPHSSGVTIANAAVVPAYNHTFSLASPRLSFTAQQNDVLSAKNAFGCKIAQLSFKVSPKTVLEAMAQIEYQGEAAVGSPTSPTFSTLQGFIFETVGNSVSFNGGTLDQAVQGFSIDVNTGLIVQYPKFGNGRYRGQLPEAVTKVTGTLDLAFESDTALQSFWGQIGSTGPQSDVLPVPLNFTFASNDMVNTAVAYGLQMILPKAKFEDAPVARKVGDYLKQTVKFTASESINGAGDDVQFVLTNASSAASF